MRFPSGDFSNVIITPKKIVTETTEIKRVTEAKVDTFINEAISQKEIVSSKVEEKLDDGDKSPELVTEQERDIAEATLRDKISSFESKITKEPVIDISKTSVKLTKEALKKHTMEQEQGLEYTQEFIREQSKQMSNIETHTIHKVSVETEMHTEKVKTVKETIMQFDSRVKPDGTTSFPKTMRTDSTLVQVSSEEDSEFLKKSTDSETETESQTTIKADKHGQKRETQTYRDIIVKEQYTKEDYKPSGNDKNNYDDVKIIKEPKLKKQLTKELRDKVSEEEINETLEEKDVSLIEKAKQEMVKAFLFLF